MPAPLDLVEEPLLWFPPVDVYPHADFIPIFVGGKLNIGGESVQRYVALYCPWDWIDWDSTLIDGVVRESGGIGVDVLLYALCFGELLVALLIIAFASRLYVDALCLLLFSRGWFRLW